MNTTSRGLHKINAQLVVCTHFTRSTSLKKAAPLQQFKEIKPIQKVVEITP
jgi:hypothetical protein